MIEWRTAARMGIRFFREEQCFYLAGAVDQGACVNETFAQAVQTLGKKRVAQLYHKLPYQLKIFLLWELIPSNDKRLDAEFMKIYIKYQNLHNIPRRDRRKGFKDYCREAERALLKYLGVIQGGKDGS